MDTGEEKADRRIMDALHHDDVAHIYDTYWVDRVHYNFLAHEMLSDLVSLGVGEKASILDIGAGTGSTTIPLSGAYGDVVGADISFEMLRILRQKGDVDAVQCTADALPFRDGTFHCVVASKVLHHMPPDVRRNAQREVFRVLKDGGLFYIIEDAAPPAALARAADRLRRHFSPDSYPDGMPTRVPWERPLAADELMSELEKAGFVSPVMRHTFHLPFNTLDRIARKDRKLAMAIWDIPKRIPLVRRLGGALLIAAVRPGGKEGSAGNFHKY